MFTYTSCLSIVMCVCVRTCTITCTNARMRAYLPLAQGHIKALLPHVVPCYAAL